MLESRGMFLPVQYSEACFHFDEFCPIASINSTASVLPRPTNEDQIMISEASLHEKKERHNSLSASNSMIVP